MVVSLDKSAKTARLSLRQAEILEQLAQKEAQGSLGPVTYHPEYGRFMLEATPAAPFTGAPTDLLNVQPNMQLRRSIARKNLLPNEVPLTVTSYPRLGVVNSPFTEPFYPPNGPAARSDFLPDEVINPHARFPTLTANIRTRRGSKVSIDVPIFVDSQTPRPFVDHGPENYIHMDAMGFGMGCCCLQLTFQATNITEARTLYDQLAPLAPLMLALTAASPAYRGYLSDQDTRWNVISGAVDDRTPWERGLVPPPEGFTTDNSDVVIPKSRYDSVDSYLAQDPVLLADEAHYNDTKLVVNKRALKRLDDAGFDPLLAQHFAHLFIRDPIVIFRELLHQDNSTSADHFENIQSTNWQTLRFKPPPPGSDIGWRVEFRPMEVQATDFENAAFTVFIVLLTRVILSYKLNFYMPISKVDENMRVAHHRDAVLNETFWFRKNVQRDSPKEYTKLSLDALVNGSDEFPGFIPLIRRFLAATSVDLDTLCELSKYLSLVSKRASGALPTNASWIRQFVTSHEDYKQDSAISESVNYALMSELDRLTQADTPPGGT